MNTTHVFKTLQDAFTLPAREVKQAIESVDCRWAEGPWIEFDLSMPGYDKSYVYTKQFYITDFRMHCDFDETFKYDKRMLNEGFCAWWDNMEWIDKQAEIETYCEKLGLIEEIKADYENWLSNKTK